MRIIEGDIEDGLKTTELDGSFRNLRKYVKHSS